MITCYVVDDEQHAVEILCDLITETPGLKLTGFTTNPSVALDTIISTEAPDLTFVDINMPKLSGMELAQMINNYTRVIFTTAYDQFAVEAFEKDAFDYLLKPITNDRFLKCITKYKKQLLKTPPAQQDGYFYIKGDVKGKIIRINLKDIIYVEGALNYVLIYTTDGKKHATYLTMEEMMNALPETAFSRIHRSFIVSNDKIKSASGGDITLYNNASLVIGDSYKKSFFEKLSQNTLKTKRNT
ncbi:MAG: LytR/AlgR family response regulator transcription factor [Mucilaginibacter sp.]